MCKYIDSDSNAALTEPVEPVMPVDKLLFDRNKPPQVWNTHIMRNQRHEDVYFNHFQVFKKNKRKWDKYYKVNAKLKECI